MRQLDTETLAAQDITTAPTVLTHTPSATIATRCALSVALSGLDASGGTFLLYVTVGGVPVQPSPMAVACGATATAIIQREFLCPANAEVIVSVQSPNAADTSVGIVATLWDTTPLQPATVGRQVAIDANGKTDPTGLPTNFSDMVIEPATQWADIVVSANGTAMTITSATGGFTEDMVGRYLYLEHADAVGVARITEYTDTNGVASANLWPTLLGDGDLTGVRGVLGGRVLASESPHRSVDATVATSNSLLSARLVGTIAAGTHQAQSGDGFARLGAPAGASVSADVAAVAAKTTNLPASPAAVGSEMALADGAITADKIAASALDGKGDWNVGKTGYSLTTAPPTAAQIKTAMEAEGGHLALILEDTGTTLPSTLSTIGGYVDCLPESWVTPPAGSDWTDTRAGYVDKLNVSGTLAHSDAAATYKADVSGVPAATKAAMEAEGSLLKETHVAATETIPTAIGEIEATVDEEALAAAVDVKLTAEHGSGSWTSDAGSGARTVTITVNDGTTALEGARVRMTKGAEDYVAITNASGQISVGRDDGTWTVAITLAGYTFTPTTLVVDGDEAATYSMTRVTITASEVAKVTGYWYTLDETGEAEADVHVEIRVAHSGGTGTAHDATTRTLTSDAEGLVEVTNLVPGVKYEARRGTSLAWKQFTVASDATTPYALPDIWGV